MATYFNDYKGYYVCYTAVCFYFLVHVDSYSLINSLLEMVLAETMKVITGSEAVWTMLST